MGDIHNCLTDDQWSLFCIVKNPISTRECGGTAGSPLPHEASAKQVGDESAASQLRKTIFSTL